MKSDAKIPESEVIEEVKNLVRHLGIHVQRINTGCFRVQNRYIRSADAGTLDFEGWDKHGRFLGIECKRPTGGRLSPAQAKRIAEINTAGGVAFVAHSGREALEELTHRGCI